MTLESFAAEGERVAIAGATPRLEAELRQACGLRGPGGPALSPRRLAYCGFDFRSYGWMRISGAVSFFEGIAPLNARLLAEYLALAGLEPSHDTQRMKTSYQRALVLALQASLEPEILVVERAQQFDEDRPAAVLREAILRAGRAVVTYDDEPTHAGLFTRTLDLRTPAVLA